MPASIIRSWAQAISSIGWICNPRRQRLIHSRSLRRPKAFTRSGATKPDEILQQLQPYALALFRMKLRGENIVAPNRRREVFPVLRSCADDRRILGFRKETMHEVYV